MVTPAAGGTRRRLAAILAADVVGSSRLMAEDEAGALARLGQLQHAVLEPRISTYGGRLFKTMGDGALLEFASPVFAVACAAAMQGIVAERASNAPEHRRVLLRIIYGGAAIGGAMLFTFELYRISRRSSRNTRSR